MHTYIHNNPPTTTPNMYRNLKQKQKTDHYILCPSRKYERKRRKKQRKIDKTLHPSPHTHTHTTLCVCLWGICFALLEFFLLSFLFSFLWRENNATTKKKKISPHSIIFCVDIHIVLCDPIFWAIKMHNTQPHLHTQRVWKKKELCIAASNHTHTHIYTYTFDYSLCAAVHVLFFIQRWECLFFLSLR